jgi:hypothetical protein
MYVMGLLCLCREEIASAAAAREAHALELQNQIQLHDQALLKQQMERENQKRAHQQVIQELERRHADELQAAAAAAVAHLQETVSSIRRKHDVALGQLQKEQSVYRQRIEAEVSSMLQQATQHYAKCTCHVNSLL